MRILSNQVRCRKCSDEPYSANRHDFKYCKCGSIAVDGGMDYLKRIGDLDSYEDISITISEEKFKACMNALEWCDETGRNNLGKVCAIFRAIRDVKDDEKED